jgi:hypothetical protein
MPAGSKGLVTVLSPVIETHPSVAVVY